MSVELDPPELGFRRPFTHEVTQVLRLRNPHNEPLAFKVKTTAPKQYCVRPNSGAIAPGREVEVQVLLQAMKEDPAPDARCRDKFLVQSVAISSDSDLNNVAAIWQTVEKQSKDAVKERKIRVTFLPAHDATSQLSSANGITHHDDAPPAYNSPSPQFGSPAPGTTSSSTYNDKSFTTPMKESASTASGSLSNAAASVTANISNAASVTSETLQQQLENAKAQIARLTEQAQDSGLRQRKTDAVVQDAREKISTGTTGMGIQSQPANGVPVQIVAALCLLSFLLAYFLF